MFRNPFEVEGGWYKANFHTHTTVSDGKATLEERIEQYASRGYAVLAITDHGTVSEVAARSTDDFLLLDGIEVGVSSSDGSRFYHLACVNVPSGLTLPGKPDANLVIDHLKHHGAATFVAHPYWTGNTLQELAPLQGHAGIEVFNAVCQDIGRGYSSVHWDEMLGAGLRVPAIAVDDAHGAGDGRDLAGGWTMLRMTELTVPAVMEAIGTACYYASSGAEILDFRVENGEAYVRCGEAREIHFMAADSHGRSLYAGDEAMLTEGGAEVGSEWKYVRAEVVSAEGKRAWTNPVFL